MAEFVMHLAQCTGVLAGGVGLLKWGLAVERRLVLIEVRTGIYK
jgi:hypothetical protein